MGAGPDKRRTHESQLWGSTSQLTVEDRVPAKSTETVGMTIDSLGAMALLHDATKR